MLSMTTEWPGADEPDLTPVHNEVREVYERLMDGDVPGSDMLGWLELPERMTGEVLSRVQEVAGEVRRRGDVFVTAGIGGSYLGARAVIEALRPFRRWSREEVSVRFAGHQLSGPYHAGLLEALEGESVYVNVISKSGTTTETALAFRLLLDHMKDRYDPEEWTRRVLVTTSADTGALLAASRQHGFRRFVIPDGVGGRYSVLSPVGLLPIAVAGIDVEALLDGAGSMARRLNQSPGEAEQALRYASVRNHLYRQGWGMEVFASFYPECRYLGKWWQQLFGESEGKEGKGLYPATVDNTTDLHSLGQFIQQGPRDLFETMLRFEHRPEHPRVPEDPASEDGLEYLAGQSLEEINREALEGTREAHLEGGVPGVTFTLPELNARTLGGLLYYFEFTCALSAVTLGVNPFNQPGVEAYKTNMYRRLGKPGYE